MASLNRNPSEIRSVFEEACAKRALLILTTQYLKIESNFVHLDGNEVYAKTATGGEDALLILHIHEIKLRFPYKLNFMEATSKLIGLGFHEGHKAIKFALPEAISVNDGRTSSRIEDLGGAYATFTSKGSRLVKADVINISHTGARLSLSDDLPFQDLKANDKIMLSIYMPDDLSINNRAVVRHREHRVFGVEFTPDLPESDQEALSNWAFRKREKELEAEAALEAHDAVTADLGIDTSDDATPEKGSNWSEGGILLITRDNDLDAALSKSLGGDRKFFRVQPNLEHLSLALIGKPHLVILHVTDSSLQERQLLESLVDEIPSVVPVLLLGTGIYYEVLFELGKEWEVVSTISWMPEKSFFLQRLVLGILRSRYDKVESN
jgi:hypothetical protein